MIRRFFATVILVATMIGYLQSPKWLLEEIDPAEANQKSFFVAFKSNDLPEASQLHVTLLRQQKVMLANYPDISFHITEEDLRNGDGNASIHITAEANGAQLIQVFMKGDTPWTSLSEYRVVDNTVYPLRHAHSSPLILLGGIIVILASLISKPLNRSINRLMRVGRDS